MGQIIFILGLFIFVSLSWFVYPIFASIQSVLLLGSELSLNEFGDMYGSLNTLFSGLAFAGVIISIRLQSKELSETRKEMKNQGAQFEQQTNALNKQVFENSFFKLLAFNNEIIQSLSFERNVPSSTGSRKEIINGRSVISYFGNIFESMTRQLDKGVVNFSNHYETMTDVYLHLNRNYTYVLDIFFRNIYQALVFLDDSDLGYIEKNKYSALIRAQLSKHEIWLLYYDCISRTGNDDFKRLLEQFEFFEFMSPESITSWQDILKYNIFIFGLTNRPMFEKYLLSLVESNEDLKEGKSVLAYYDGNVEPVDITGYPFDHIKSELMARKIIWIELSENSNN